MTETKTDKTETAATTADEKSKLLNPIQLAGGALAAVTSAAVGSNLGVAGTLGGAAVASVVAGVAGALYTRGLENTRDGVKKIVLRDPDGNTEVITVTDEGDTQESSLQQTAIASDSDRPATTSGPATPVRGAAAKRPAGWKRPVAIAGGALVTAATTFVIAMGLITGWEASTGQTLDGQSGTTIGQRRSSPTPSATPSATPTASASATPTESTSTEPSATPTASETPTATPTESATTEPSAEPSETEVAHEAATEAAPVGE